MIKNKKFAWAEMLLRGHINIYPIVLSSSSSLFVSELEF